MPPKSIHKVLNYYYTVLKRCADRIACPHCKISMLPEIFEKHCSSGHGIDGKKCCVWCRQLTWANGEKNLHVNHLINCFKDFLKSRNISAKRVDNSNKSYRLLTLDHACTEKNLYGHVLATPDSDSIASEFFPEECVDLTSSKYDSVCPLETDSLPPSVTFPDRNLNLAGSYVRMYRETHKTTHDWIHIMVKAVAFESFVRAMEEDGGSSRTLEFSCWCDGGPSERAEQRQHRHMIAVSSPKGHFEREVWPKVKVSKNNKPPGIRNFPCKRLKHIKSSPLHLVNAMGYVSQRKSRCEFSFQEKKNNKNSPIKLNHFYIYKTLPKSYKIHLVQFWDNGISQLLYQEKFQNISIPRLAESSLVRVGEKQWKQKIKDFYGHERGLVLNVSRQFVPTDKATPYFFCLTEGRRLYFEYSPATLDYETWLRKQATGGNCFYDNMEENAWFPRKRDQKVLNFYKPVLDRKSELELENASLKRKLEDTNNSLNEKIRQLEITKATNKTYVKRMNDQIKSLQSEITKLNNEIKCHVLNINKLQSEENGRLKIEIHRLKLKLAKFEQTN